MLHRIVQDLFKLIKHYTFDLQIFTVSIHFPDSWEKVINQEAKGSKDSLWSITLVLLLE